MTSPRGHRRFVAGMLIDSVGSGLYLPFSLLFFHTVSGLPLATVGIGLSVAALVGLTVSPLAGALIDRFGAKPVMVASYTLRAVAFLAYLTVGNVYTFVLVAVLAAVGDRAFSPANQAFIGELADGRDREKLLALSRSVRNGGMGAGGLIASAAIAGGGQVGYLAIAVLNSASFLAAAVLLRGVGAAGGRRAGMVVPRTTGGYRTVLTDRPFLALTGINALIALAYSALNFAIPVYATGTLGVSAGWVGITFGLNTALVALLSVPLARFTGRVRRTRAAALGAALFALSFVLFPLSALWGGPALLLAVVVVYTAGEMVHSTPAGALAISAASPDLRGRYLTFYQLSWSSSAVIAPALFTALLGRSAGLLWIVLGVAALAAALGFLAVERRLPAAVAAPTTAPAATVSRAPVPATN